MAILSPRVIRERLVKAFLRLPMEGFSGIDPDLVAAGSLEKDNDSKSVWISLLAFNQMGRLLRFDMETKKFTIFELPGEIKSPVALV